MAVILEGGCRVSIMDEGECLITGTLSVWQQIGHAVGARAISLRILKFAPGLSPGLCNENSDDLLYLLENLDGQRDSTTKTEIFIDGKFYEIEPRTGIYLRPGQTLTVNNRSPDSIIFVSSLCPEPATPITLRDPITRPIVIAGVEEQIPVVPLASKKAMPTADRWYRVLVDHEIGSTQVTQFVGSIPPGRAPDHFHEYEEVLFILRGVGRMWSGATNTSIKTGSCVYLPRGQVHCVENTGDGELRLLGVFYPAGSPAVRYEV